jgi:hypothetical protein
MRDDPISETPPPIAVGDCCEAIGNNPLKETLARAEQATTALRANYTEWARVDVDRAQALFDAARDDASARRAQLDQVFTVMHNIKGQGTSFGYPLVTRIGQSLCRLIEPGRTVADPDLKVVQVHLDALKLVLDKKIAGTGGGAGEALATRLESMTANALR